MKTIENHWFCANQKVLTIMTHQQTTDSTLYAHLGLSVPRAKQNARVE